MYLFYETIKRKNIREKIKNRKMRGIKMNLCFLIGKISSDIQYHFILEGENTAIVKFEIELLNTSRIQVKGYNEIADNSYRELQKGNDISIIGKLLEENKNITVKIESYIA